MPHINFHVNESYDVTHVDDEKTENNTTTPEPPLESSRSTQGSTQSFWNRKVFVSPVKAIIVIVVALLLIAVVGILAAMFGPGKNKESTGNPRVADTNEEGAKHSTSTLAHQTQPATTKESVTTKKPEQTTAAPTALTTESPTTGSGSKRQIKCGVAIIGGGIPSLYMAKELLQKKTETDVCVFEKENYFGGRIYDFVFQQHVPNVTVALGTSKVEADDEALSKIIRELNITLEDWNFVKPERLEARGVLATSYEDLKTKAFPTLLQHPKIKNYTLEEIAIYMSSNTSEPENTADHFSTAETFLSYYLSSEGTKFVAHAYGFSGSYMQLMNPFSYRTYLWGAVNRQNSNKRPVKGMSELTKEILRTARNYGAETFTNEKVQAVNSNGKNFVVETSNLTVTASKVVFAVTPVAIREIKGDVPRSIVGHEIFQSIQSVPAFQGAAVYRESWWNDSLSNNNDSLRPLQQFVSSSDCLGVTMPYEGRGPNGEAVLQIMSTNGACSDKWADIMKLSKTELDKEVRRALEYKFSQPVPKALETHYKSWQNGYWFFQKPGHHHSLQEIRNWATKPLTSRAVFLVGSAYYNFGGSLNDGILSSQNALREGWLVAVGP